MGKSQVGTSKRKRHAEDENLQIDINVNEKQKKKKLKLEETNLTEDPHSKKKTLKSIKNNDSFDTVKSNDDQDVENYNEVEAEEKRSKKVKKSSMKHEEVDEDENHGLEESENMESKMDDLTHTIDLSGRWTKEEHSQLLEQVERLLPEKDTHEYSKTLKKLDWSNVAVPGKSSNECRAEYHGILKKLRKYKTMAEILSDAKEWLEKESTKLKKPLRPHEQYCMTHRDKYIGKHPELSISEVMARLSKKYEKITDEKKQKYVDKYNEEMKTYKKELMNSRRAEAPPSFPLNPMQLYLKDKYEEQKDSGVARGVIYMEKKEAWKGLKNEEKLKYINESVRLKGDYEMKMKAYCELHPDYKPVQKCILTKSEQQIRDNFLGKPLKPPGSGYAIFTRDFNKKLHDCNLAERGQKVSEAWKNLPQEEKDKLNVIARKDLEEYERNLALFRKKYPDEVLEEKEKPKKPKKVKNDF